MSFNRDIQKQAQKEVQALQEEYGLEGVPENVRLTLASVTARGTPDPTAAGEAAVRKMEIACLAAWARGKVAGPDSPESLERRAKQAESLAKMFEKKDDPKNAKKQRTRAEGFRKQAASMVAAPKENT